MIKPGIKKLSLSTWLICILANSSTPAISRQDLDEKPLRNITSTVQRVLKKNWKVERAVVSDSEGYKGYLIKVVDPTKTFVEERAGKSGTREKISYNPSYTLFFVPLSNNPPANEIREEIKRARNSPRQVPVFDFYGSSATYVLLYEQSDQTNWRSGLKVIADAFQIAEDPPDDRQ